MVSENNMARKLFRGDSGAPFTKEEKFWLNIALLIFVILTVIFGLLKWYFLGGTMGWFAWMIIWARFGNFLEERKK